MGSEEVYSMACFASVANYGSPCPLSPHLASLCPALMIKFKIRFQLSGLCKAITWVPVRSLESGKLGSIDIK